MSEDLTTGGHVRPITRWGTPVMHETTRPVTEFGDELHELVRDMFATMRAAEGVGLAATQVGVGVSVFIYECPDADDRVQRGVVCNPVVELPRGKDRNLDITEEGCLSWPGGYSGVPRPDKAICRGQDAYGKEIELLGTGLLARCFQHETDHLNGTVFGDRISDRSRRKLDAQVADLAWRYPEDWPISPKRDSAPRPGEQ
ncbi:peptide deformylase [Arachnia propionica]|jgi:peptide deformylase|uniref:Peptide deformylase n=1 Tax=Arachnia propionica TaxID=1750 RepID=A0A3N4CZ62_9ACTN|nr:peptide deformylase [Arachnia propionica]AFN46910.1 peptide deformylase [Arachnia propionica F0230a]QCT37455.1 peptide deformylase [Arachnia propionica]QUC10190.1 peptide deformylase [Arachnia propionica]QUC15128.1 peptide deformylase [Arachnia propionica]RPA17102.1 peptide deformylase [Arachnia propionica]